MFNQTMWIDDLWNTLASIMSYATPLLWPKIIGPHRRSPSRAPHKLHTLQKVVGRSKFLDQILKKSRFSIVIYSLVAFDKQKGFPDSLRSQRHFSMILQFLGSTNNSPSKKMNNRKEKQESSAKGHSKKVPLHTPKHLTYVSTGNRWYYTA